MRAFGSRGDQLCCVRLTFARNLTGANNSDKPRLGVITYYGEPYVRTIENNFASISPKQVLKLPTRLQVMLG